MHKMQLTQAPDLVTMILSHLPANDLHHAELVCKEWHLLCAQHLWRAVFVNRYHGIYKEATEKQCQLKYEMAKNLVPILSNLHSISCELKRDEFFSSLKSAKNLPLPRVVNTKALLQYDAKRHLQLDMKLADPYKAYCLDGTSMTIIQPFSEEALQDIFVKNYKDCYIRACTSSFMLFAYAMRMCNQIGFVDLMAKQQILTFVPFEDGVIDSIELVHDCNVMNAEKQQYPNATHFAAYRFFACGTTNGLPYLQEYLIVDKQEKDQQKFDCTHTMVHDYVTPDMTEAFQTVDYDVDADILTASTSSAMFIFRNRQLVAVVGNGETVPNVPCFEVPTLTSILTCKSYVIVKNTILELKLVSRDEPSILHRVLFDMSCSKFTHIYSVPLTCSATYTHFQNQNGFSDSGAYLWYNVDFNDHNDLGLEYALHNMHANTAEFLEQVHSDEFAFESTSNFAWDYKLLNIGQFEGDYVYQRDYKFCYHPAGKEDIQLRNAPVSKQVFNERIGEKKGTGVNSMGHLTMYGICIQLEECWFRASATSATPSTNSNLIRYW